MNPRVSIQILVKDRPAEIYGLLTSIFLQPYKEWDLVVIDESDNGPIKTQKYISDMFIRMKFDGHGVFYHPNPPENRRGISHARNLAVEKDPFKNELIIRIDDDSIVDNEYISRLVGIIEKDEKNEIGAVGGLVPTFGIDYVRKISSEDSFESVTFSGEKIDVTDSGGTRWEPVVVLPSMHLRSSFLFRRSVWEKIGGFDESQGGNTGWREETVFCMDIAWAGYGILIDTGAICHHVRTFRGGGSQNAANPNYQAMMAMNEAHFLNRNLRKFDRLGNPYNKEWFEKCQRVITK